MPQYLTSSKICLLVLAALYCEGFVPTGAAIQVLSLLNSQQLPTAPPASKNVPTGTERPRGIIELQEIKSVLEKHQSAWTARPLWDQYLIILGQVCNIDALFDFFASLKQLFTPREIEGGPAIIVISKTSLVGAFVRRSQVEFEKISFQDVVSLWESFKRFVAPVVMLSTNYEDELQAMDEAAGGKISRVMSQADDWAASERHGHFDSSQTSSHDAERFLEAQQQRMREFDYRLPDAANLRLEDLSHPSAQTASASYYVKFINASFSGDYSTGFEFLHRYYDYDMRLRSGQSFYQFALLSTALFQADLGCYDEAVKALNETVAIARENKDTWCLIFTLHWLYYIQTTVGKDVMGSGSKGIFESDAKSLAFLKAKAVENKAWSIASASLLREAQLGLSHGRPPYEALERVHEAASMNAHHQMWSETRLQNLQQSALFSRLGCSSLSSSYCNLVMESSPRAVQGRDKLQARCRNAYAAILAGDYKSARKLTGDLKSSSRDNLSMQQVAQTFNGLLKLKASFHHNDLKDAELLLSALSKTAVADPDLRFQIALLNIEYLSRVKDFDKACDTIEALLSPNNNASHPHGHLRINRQDVCQNIQLLLAKAKLFITFKMPQKGFSIALRATVAAMEAHIVLLLWEAVGVLSKVLIATGEAEKACKLLESIVWQATESNDCEIMALLQSTYADAQVSCAGLVKDDKVARVAPLRQALKWSERAYQSFESLDDIIGKREMAAKMTVAFRLLGDDDSATAKATLFQELDAQSKRNIEL